MLLPENVEDREETARIMHASLMSEYWFAMPVTVSAATEDGHVAQLVPTVQRRVQDPATGEFTFEDHPIHPDAPIHYASGGGVTATHPVAQGDEGIALYFSRNQDAWHQSGGSQQPMDNRTHSIRDATYIPGIRSDPRKLQQVSNEAYHVRSDDKKHVSEVHPQNGITHTSVDPSTAPASATFDPLSMATKFIRHAISGVSGLLGQAVNDGTTHDHGIDYVAGPFMRAANALHSVLCHPQNGPSLNAADLLHSVLASPTLGAVLSGNKGASTVTAGMSGVTLAAATISLSCPAGGLSLPSGGVSTGSLAPGAASENVGVLTGDLAGELPSPTVVGILNVANGHLLPTATNDAAAAALTPAVPIGGLYRNGSVLMVRVA